MYRKSQLKLLTVHVLQLIVSEDGVNGLCYEHCPTEGPPIANLADFIVNYA